MPKTDDQLRAFTSRYFEEYDELSRRFDAGDGEGGPVPSDLIFDLFDAGRIDDAWRLISALVDSAPTDDALGFVGAGVLEDLCTRGYATDALYRQIADRAQDSDRLRYALGVIYWGGCEPDWFRAELQTLGVTVYVNPAKLRRKVGARPTGI